jgi:hypothetical protein
MHTITFLRGWQGRAVGSQDSRLPLGIMKTLVMAGTAEFTTQGMQQPQHQAKKRRSKR